MDVIKSMRSILAVKKLIDCLYVARISYENEDFFEAIEDNNDKLKDAIYKDGEGNVYIVEMASTEHEAIICWLISLEFQIMVAFSIQELLWKWPTLRILMHGIQNVKRGCVSDTYNFIFGIKLDRIKNNGNRSMLARLWTRMNPVSAGFVALTDSTLPGVSVKFWDFDTLQYGGNNPTGCI
ncbi:hypothetical protein RhiirC2_711986 [Rhizophagus irregularis]|uniref:Uncharacterized protein n=1 Tax=Rhizophagus irregularis TaxID=588596 RepID=A0A2N1N8S0_9GLOM|nr:hypothetical protein RhiirC2_711986 [Rhizophagus irregularis]